MIFGLFKTMYFFILHFEVRNLGFMDFSGKSSVYFSMASPPDHCSADSLFTSLFLFDARLRTLFSLSVKIG